MVRVVVGVDERVVALGPAGDLERTVGDDLVGVHVRRGAGSALDDADGELVVEFAGFDLFAGRVDEVRALVIERSDLGVGPGCGLFDAGEGADEVGIDGDGAAGDGEVLVRTGRVHSPVRGVGDLEAADRVGLGAGGEVLAGGDLARRRRGEGKRGGVGVCGGVRLSHSGFTISHFGRRPKERSV